MRLTFIFVKLNTLAKGIQRKCNMKIQGTGHKGSLGSLEGGVGRGERELGERERKRDRHSLLQRKDGVCV